MNSFGRKCFVLFFILTVILTPSFRRINNVHELRAGLLKRSGWCLGDSMRLGLARKQGQLGKLSFEAENKWVNLRSTSFYKNIPWRQLAPDSNALGRVTGSYSAVPQTISNCDNQSPLLPPFLPFLADWPRVLCRHSVIILLPNSSLLVNRGGARDSLLSLEILLFN